MNTIRRSLLIGGLSSLGLGAALGPGCGGDPASGSAESTTSSGSGGATSTAGHGGATATTGGQGGSTTSSASQGTGGNPNGVAVWSKRFGGPEHDWGTVGTDAMGNVLFAGAIWGKDDLGGGPLGGAGQHDAFVAKFDGAGKLLFGKSYGDSKSQRVYAVRADALGNVLVAGDFFGSIDLGGGSLIDGTGWPSTFVAKLDPSGAHVWSKKFEPADAPSLAMGAQDDLFLSGTFRDTVDFGGGPLVSAGSDDIYLVHLDASGAHLWSKKFGDSTGQQAPLVAVDATGATVMAGALKGTLDFGGGPLSAAGIKAFVAKFDASGGHVWSEAISGAMCVAYILDLAVAPTGEMYLAGGFSGTADFGGSPMTSTGATVDAFLVKLDAAGKFVWGKNFAAPGGTWHPAGTGVAVAKNGDVVFSGTFGGTIDLGGGMINPGAAGDTDAFIARYDPTGKHLSSVHLDHGPANLMVLLEAPRVAIVAGGDVIVQGKFWNNIDLGQGVLASQGFTDLFLARLKP